jgi:hypothetical protein
MAIFMFMNDERIHAIDYGFHQARAAAEGMDPKSVGSENTMFIHADIVKEVIPAAIRLRNATSAHCARSLKDIKCYIASEHVADKVARGKEVEEKYAFTVWLKLAVVFPNDLRTGEGLEIAMMETRDDNLIRDLFKIMGRRSEVEKFESMNLLSCIARTESAGEVEVQTPCSPIAFLTYD